jgi:hypothetical protein
VISSSKGDGSDKLNHFLEECAYFALHGMFPTKALTLMVRSAGL